MRGAWKDSISGAAKLGVLRVVPYDTVSLTEEGTLYDIRSL
jgi:hypothetical protein